MGAEASVEIQMAARKVLEENRRLRRIIEDYGLVVEDNADKPEEKLEGLLNKKRKVDDFAEGGPSVEPLGRFSKLSGEEASTSRAIPGVGSRGSASREESVASGADIRPRQQLSLITPKIEPGLHPTRQDSWNSEESLGQSPQPQMSVAHWSATSPIPMQWSTQRQQDWTSGITGMHQNAAELAAAAGLPVSDPGMGYLLADPDTLLEQMYGIPRGSQYATMQPATGQPSSNPDPELYWSPQHQRQQLTPVGTPQQQPSQIGTPLYQTQSGTPQNHQYMQPNPPDQQQQQNQMFPPSHGYRYHPG